MAIQPNGNKVIYLTEINMLHKMQENINIHGTGGRGCGSFAFFVDQSKFHSQTSFLYLQIITNFSQSVTNILPYYYTHSLYI